MKEYSQSQDVVKVATGKSSSNSLQQWCMAKLKYAFIDFYFCLPFISTTYPYRLFTT